MNNILAHVNRSVFRILFFPFFFLYFASSNLYYSKLYFSQLFFYLIFIKFQIRDREGLKKCCPSSSYCTKMEQNEQVIRNQLFFIHLSTVLQFQKKKNGKEFSFLLILKALNWESKNLNIYFYQILCKISFFNYGKKWFKPELSQVFIIFMMWFSYLLSNTQAKSSQQISYYPSYDYSLNFEILKDCLQKEISLYRIQKNFSPYIISENAKTKIQPSQDMNQVKLLISPGTNMQEVEKQDNISSVVSSKKKVIKKMKSKKLKKQSGVQLEKGKNPGRNSTSNIFRVFLKLCSKSTFEELLKEKIEQISRTHKLEITLEIFKMKIKQLAPSTSNYINVKQFTKIWSDDCQFSKIFRCLFHWFLSNFGVNHSLTLKGKHKMMKESITHFLNNLRDIQNDICRNEQEEEQMQE